MKRSFTASGRADWKKLRQYRNIHAGERCVIIGNGPSLQKTDMSLLRDEITFGLNRIYLMFEQLGWQPTYHVVVNYLIAEQCAEDLESINAPFFTASINRKYFAQIPDAIYMNCREDGYSTRGPRFSRNVSLGYWEGATVTYATLQLAYYMGFTDVIIVGVDHRFSISGPPGEIVESEGQDPNHFTPNYFGPGFKWQLPGLELSDLAYRLAREEFEKKGRRVVDSTVDGALTAFPKMPLKKALNRPVG